MSQLTFNLICIDRVLLKRKNHYDWPTAQAILIGKGVGNTAEVDRPVARQKFNPSVNNGCRPQLSNIGPSPTALEEEKRRVRITRPVADDSSSPNGKHRQCTS